MAEYAERRAAVMGAPSSSLLLSPSPSPEVIKATEPGKSLPLKPEMHPIEENLTALSVMGGWRAAVACVFDITVVFRSYELTSRFKYDPMTLYLMLFALTSSSPSVHAPKRRKLDTPRPNREIILADSRNEKERIILVPKPPPPQDEPGSTMDIDSANPVGAILTEGFMRYDLYREMRDPLTVPSEQRAELDESLKPKGVHFAADIVNKANARDPDNASWTRTLLHSDLGPQDILCIPDCLLVGDDKYTVETWRWKSEPEDAKRTAEKVSQVARSKKRGLRKRKMKARKPKGDAAVTEAVTTETEVVQSSASVPAPVKEDREEGELSDETPAAA
jgi:hypothetical protein